MAQIKSFGVLQTATVVAACYALGAVLMSIPMVLVNLAAGGGQVSGLMVISMVLAFPVLLGIGMGIGSFIFIAILCFFYNLVASFVGGIEIEIE